MPFSEIRYDVEDGVCTVTLNRPDRLNAVTPTMLGELAMFWTGRSADAREGVTAFLEKRPARFTLRSSADLPPFYPWWRPRSSLPSRD